MMPYITRKMTKRAVQAALFLLLGACTLGPPIPAHMPGIPANTCETGWPLTVPAIQEWTEAAPKQYFHLRDHGHILISPVADSGAREALERTAILFSDDLYRKTDIRLDVITQATGPVEEGDIRFRLTGTDRQLDHEGYQMDIGTSIDLSAPQETGVFYGTQTLLQLFRQCETIRAGHIRDWPHYQERGLLVDVGRKYFSEQWLEERVRDLAYLKMNFMQLHLSDNEGFRIENPDPEIMSEDYLTRQDIIKLRKMAHQYHVTIVPDIDMPGHMEKVLQKHPDFQLRDKNGTPTPSVLDFTRHDAREFAENLVTEYITLFDSPYWAVGGDEITGGKSYTDYPQLTEFAIDQSGNPNATAEDAINYFLNDINRILRSHGKTMRVWNDALTEGSIIPLDDHIIVDWWVDYSFLAAKKHTIPPQELLNSGRTIANSSYWPTYYVAAWQPLWPQEHDMKAAYESWRVDQFFGYFPWNSGTVATGNNHLLGSRLSLWNDNPWMQSVEEITRYSYYRLRIMAQKTWESEPVVGDYSQFKNIVDRIGHPPAPESPDTVRREEAPE